MIAGVCEMVARVCAMYAGVCEMYAGVAQFALEFVAQGYWVHETPPESDSKPFRKTNASRTQVKPTNKTIRNNFKTPKQLTPKSAHPVLHAGTSKRHAARHTPGPHVPPRGSWGFPTDYFKTTSKTLQTLQKIRNS